MVIVHNILPIESSYFATTITGATETARTQESIKIWNEIIAFQVWIVEPIKKHWLLENSYCLSIGTVFFSWEFKKTKKILLLFSAGLWLSRLTRVIKEFSFPIRNIEGVIVTLDEVGFLQCSYLGTDPSMMVTPAPEARDINYEVRNFYSTTIHY